MKCARVRQRLLEEGKRRSAQVEDHLNQCASCRAWAREQTDLARFLANAGDLTPPAEVMQTFRRQVMARLSNAQGRRPRRSAAVGPLGRRRLALLALAAVVAGLVLVSQWRQNRPPLDAPRSTTASDPVNLVVESAQIDGRDANLSVFELPQTETVIIWLD